MRLSPDFDPSAHQSLVASLRLTAECRADLLDTETRDLQPPAAQHSRRRIGAGGVADLWEAPGDEVHVERPDPAAAASRRALDDCETGLLAKTRSAEAARPQRAVEPV